MRKSVNIYGMRVKIKHVESLKHPETGETCLGLFDPTTKVIWLEANISDKEKYATLCHEIIHATQFRLGYMQIFQIEFIETMAETFGNMIAENFKLK